MFVQIILNKSVCNYLIMRNVFQPFRKYSFTYATPPKNTNSRNTLQFQINALKKQQKKIMSQKELHRRNIVVS